MKLHLYPIELPLQHVFRTAVVERTTQPTLIVALEEEGCCGYGECTENTFFGATIKNIQAEIYQLRPLLRSLKRNCSPEMLHAQLQRAGLHPFACCAIDEAMHDLRSKQLGQPLYKHWGLQAKPLISSYTIGLDTVENMQQKIQEKPWPIYKIKLDKKNGIPLIRALRQVTDAIFRVDINGAWDLEESIVNSKMLKELGVEFIEQPLPRQAKAEQQQLYTASALPVIADESCEHEDDLKSCIGLFHGVNMKLTKAGGLTPLRRMIATAQSAGLQCMVGCMVESSIGISAIAQLVPLLDYVDMDGALLLAEDPATGVEVTKNGVRYSAVPGTGAALKQPHT